MSREELAYFVETFEVTGFTGGLNWYRAAFLGGSNEDVVNWDIDVPCLYIGAQNDVILRPSSADHIGNFVRDFQRHIMEDCGHWTQQEKPDEFNRVTIDWLKAKFVG